jgi:CubicO group peptidase (beta-lactamase class C family)
LKSLYFVAALLGLQSCATPSRLGGWRAEKSIAEVDRIVDDVMARYRLPGIAVGIVRDGRIVYQRTAGEVIEGSGQRVDGETLFKIASNSKAMTTGVLARLVDRGKLRWDEPVVKYLPSFRMSDPWVTQRAAGA